MNESANGSPTSRGWGDVVLADPSHPPHPPHPPHSPLLDSSNKPVDGGAANESTRAALSSRRMAFIVALSLLSAIVFSVAPLSLSLPFSVVALLAPVLAGCDCRHSRVKSSSASVSVSVRGGDGSQQRDDRPSVTATDTPANTLRAAMQLDSGVRGGGHHSVVNGGLHTASASTTAISDERPADRPYDGSSSSGGIKVERDSAHKYESAELTMVRSEERMSVRKERVVTSRLVVRKVVTTEMVIMSVPVRRERLEVETVYEEAPFTLSDDSSINDEAATKGGVRTLPPLSIDRTTTANSTAAYVPLPANEQSSADRHNYAGVDESGQEVIELLLCEERPRIEMDVMPVTRVTITKLNVPSSQLLHMELRKEQIQYVAPHQPKQQHAVALSGGGSGG